MGHDAVPGKSEVTDLDGPAAAGIDSATFDGAGEYRCLQPDLESALEDFFRAFFVRGHQTFISP